MDNSASESGGGVHISIREDGGAYVSNNAFYGNTSPEGSDISVFSDINGDSIPGNVTVKNNAMDAANGYYSLPLVTDEGTVSVAADDFTDYAARDLSPSVASALIDAGINEFVGHASDLYGAPRITNSVVDIGAIESQP